MLLKLSGIEKRFGGVTALRRGDLEVHAGEVHLLMGENGAGKSTLMKIVAGMTAADGGQLLWRGQPASFARPSEASAVGIAMVHQESLLAPHLSVAENIFLGREKGFLADRSAALKRARQLIADRGFPLQAEWPVERLSAAGRQLVEICRAISQGSSLLIFDEPTSSLSEQETQEVFRIVESLKARGLGVIYITHRLEELRRLGDRVTVLRDGETVHQCSMSQIDTASLIRHMVGREVSALYSRRSITPGEVLLEAMGISNSHLREVSLQLRAGEIVGLAGLMGAGRTELCRALFGVDRIASGELRVCGAALRPRSPRDAVAAGVALIPEDRQRTGLARLLPISHNTTIASLDRVSRRGWIDGARETASVGALIDRLRIRASSASQLAGRLSGGNQQKVVIAKWLARGARVFLFDEPTRGIDVAAKAEVFQAMDQLARDGAAILMVSSELPELIQVADRIAVMRGGRIAGALPRGASQEDILRLAAFQAAPGSIAETAE